MIWPLWLYQQPCESGVLRPVYRACTGSHQRTVRTNPLIGVPPALHDDRHFQEDIQLLLIQPFIT